LNKRITKIALTTETAKSVPYNQFLGYEGENNIAELVFEFTDGFVEGRAKLVLLREDMEPGYLDLVRVEDTYVLPVESALISKNGDITFCLTIYDNQFDIIAKYDPFVMTVKDAPDTDIPMPEDYPTWSKLADDKLIEVDNKITEVDNALAKLQEDVESGKFDGDDYVLTLEDKEEIKQSVKDEVLPEIKDEIPKKTSDLVNDSNFAKTNTNNNFSTSQTVNGDLTINGNIVQNGETFETHAEQVYTKNANIILRDEAVGGLGYGELSGLIVTLYNGIKDGCLGFDADGIAYVGDVGDEQPLLTRLKSEFLYDGQVLVWDAAALRAVGSDNFLQKTDRASTSEYGPVKLVNDWGIGVNDGRLWVIPATNQEIDERTTKYKTIQPSNLVYAVGSVKASQSQSGTAKMWISTNEYGEVGLNISTEV